MPATVDHHELLLGVLSAQPELRFGFVARATGELLTQAGDPSTLPYQGVVDVAMRPESIAAKYDECDSYARTDPSMLPRGLAQGAIRGIIGIPCPGVLLVVFGVMPDELGKAPPTEQVSWYSSFRRRVWSAVEAAYRR